jgi:uncharacterized protein YggU (UPF0235/DUF167 family)
MIKLRIKARPRARCDEVLPASELDGLMTVAVTAAAADGKANAAICKTLAQWAGVPPSSVTITSGHTARIKTVAFATVDQVPIFERKDRL